MGRQDELLGTAARAGGLARRSLIAASALAVVGCALTPFGRLERNLDQLGDLAVLYGQVVDAEGLAVQATVVALRAAADGWQVENVVTTHEGRFLLRVQPSVPYRVLAWAGPGGARPPEPGAAFALEPAWMAGLNGQVPPRVLVLRVQAAGIDAPLQTALRNVAGSTAKPMPVSIGNRSSLDHPMFDATVGSMGFWAPAEFLASVGGGVYLLQDPVRGRLPVLMVHGAAGTPRDLAPVIGVLDRARTEPWVFHYPSGLRLEAAATMLAGIVAELTPRLGLTRLAIVAHSMGGLVAMDAIRLLSKRVPSLRVPLLATVSSPWGGHGAASWGVKLAPTAIPSWIDMQPDSPFLQSLKQIELPTGSRHHLYFAYRGRGDDGTITLASQLDPVIQRRAARVRGFDADHVSVLSDAGLLAELRAAVSALG